MERRKLQPIVAHSSIYASVRKPQQETVLNRSLRRHRFMSWFDKLTKTSFFPIALCTSRIHRRERPRPFPTVHHASPPFFFTGKTPWQFLPGLDTMHAAVG